MFVGRDLSILAYDSGRATVSRRPLCCRTGAVLWTVDPTEEPPIETTADDTVTTPARRERLVWMDGFRGIAIVLIIVLHGTAMLESIGLAIPESVDLFNTVASPFRIPLLMTLSGMLLGGSLSKGVGRYLTGKLRAIAWPYLLWLCILLLVFPDLGIETVIRGLWAPNTYLWYLHTLLIAYLAALALRRVPTWISAVVALLLAAVASLVSLPATLEMMSVDRVLLMLGYFFAGHLLAQHLQTALRWMRSPWGIAIGLLGTAVVVALSVQGSFAVPSNELLAPPLMASLALGIALLSQLPWNGPLSHALRWVGRHSIVYYVTHWILLYWTLQLTADPVMAWGVGWLLAAMITGALLAATLLAWLVHLRTPVRWLFRV